MSASPPRGELSLHAKGKVESVIDAGAVLQICLTLQETSGQGRSEVIVA
jgi:hypothetical protein